MSNLLKDNLKSLKETAAPETEQKSSTLKLSGENPFVEMVKTLQSPPKPRALENETNRRCYCVHQNCEEIIYGVG